MKEYLINGIKDITVGFSIFTFFVFVTFMLFVYPKKYPRQIRCEIITEKILIPNKRSQYFFIFSSGKNKEVFLQEYLDYNLNEEYCY